MTLSVLFVEVVVIFSLEEVLDGFGLIHWGREVAEGVAEEEGVASVVDDVVSDHAGEDIVIGRHLLLLNLLHLHQVLQLRMQTVILAELLRQHMHIDEVIHYVLQLL